VSCQNGLVQAVPVASEGLRERKKARTRQAFEDAALTLFERQGFEGTTVEQIAELCEVSPRTFFRYFATKEDVLFGDAADKRALLISAIESRPTGEPPLRSMRAAVLALTALYHDDKERRRRRADVVAATPMLRAHGSERQEEWNDVAVDALARRRGVDAHDNAAMFDLRLTVAAATGAVRAAMQIWLADDSTDLRALVERAFDRLATGLDA